MSQVFRAILIIVSVITFFYIARKLKKSQVEGYDAIFWLVFSAVLILLSVLPGIASRRTVLANHCAEFISHPKARTGTLDGNPIHEDMLFAAKAAKLAFIVNVVINAEKRIVAAFAGDPVAAHRAGTEYLSRHARIEVPEADIVVTGNGGYPLDQNVYQSVKGMTAGEAVCREGGVIILCASCSDGHGGESFYRHLAGGTPQQILDEVSRIPRDRTEPDQWEYQILARILVKHTVIVVTKDCDHRMLHAMHLLAASSIDEALAKAFELCGPDAKVAAIPDGVSVIARKKTGLQGVPGACACAEKYSFRKKGKK